MKDESGHFGDHPQTPISPNAGRLAAGFSPLPDEFSGHPDHQALLDAVNSPRLSSPYYAAELMGAPSAWKSAPGAVRFAVWLWAISTIVGFVGALIFLLVMLIGGSLALSQM